MLCLGASGREIQHDSANHFAVKRGDDVQPQSRGISSSAGHGKLTLPGNPSIGFHQLPMHATRDFSRW